MDESGQFPILLKYIFFKNCCQLHHKILIIVLISSLSFSSVRAIDFGLTWPASADVSYTHGMYKGIQAGATVGFMRIDTKSELSASGFLKAGVGLRFVHTLPAIIVDQSLGKVSLGISIKGFWQNLGTESVADPNSFEYHDLGVFRKKYFIHPICLAIWI